MKTYEALQRDLSRANMPTGYNGHEQPQPQQMPMAASAVDASLSTLSTSDLAVALAQVRRAQFAAYWSAPFATRDADILAAIYRGWYFLEREQFPGVLMPFTAFAR